MELGRVRTCTSVGLILVNCQPVLVEFGIFCSLIMTFHKVFWGKKLGSSTCFYKVCEFINKRESFNGCIKDNESRRTNDGTRLGSDYIRLPVELC